MSQASSSEVVSVIAAAVGLVGLACYLPVYEREKRNKEEQEYRAALARREREELEDKQREKEERRYWEGLREQWRRELAEKEERERMKEQEEKMAREEKMRQEIEGEESFLIAPECGDAKDVAGTKESKDAKDVSGAARDEKEKTMELVARDWINQRVNDDVQVKENHQTVDYSLMPKDHSAPLGQSFVAYKKVGKTGLIARLIVPKEALRVTTNHVIELYVNGKVRFVVVKVRAQYAYVDAIRDLAGRNYSRAQSSVSTSSPPLCYEVGKWVYPDGVDVNPHNRFSQGINCHMNQRACLHWFTETEWEITETRVPIFKRMGGIATTWFNHVWPLPFDEADKDGLPAKELPAPDTNKIAAIPIRGLPR